MSVVGAHFTVFRSFSGRAGYDGTGIEERGKKEDE